MAGVEHVAELLLSEVDAIEADLQAGDDGEAALGGIGDAGEGVDGRDLEGEVGSQRTIRNRSEDETPGQRPVAQRSS